MPRRPSDPYRIAARAPPSQVMALNHGLDPEFILEGQTILLPSGSLSSRDKDILRGIGPRSYRTYPVRSGEVRRTERT